MPSITVEIAGRRYRITHDWSCGRWLELNARPEHDAVRVPLELVQGFETIVGVAVGSIQVSWPALKTPTSICVSSLKIWPSAASWYRTNWEGYDGEPTWVGLERASAFGRDQDRYVLIRPDSDLVRSGSVEKWAPEVLGFPLWRTGDRPHLWPQYRLYGGAGGELILYTIGGLAHGRFKLAKRQLDNFLSLRCKGALLLGFYDKAQGIDVTYQAEGVRLPPPKNADKSEPYYVIDAAGASRRTEQLSLAL